MARVFARQRVDFAQDPFGAKREVFEVPYWGCNDK